MEKKRSDLWYHFSFDNVTKKAKCLYCKNIISLIGGGTGNLSRHLKRKHPTISLPKTAQPSQIPEQTPSTSSHFPVQVSFSLPSGSTDNVTLGQDVEQGTFVEPEPFTSTCSAPIPYRQRPTGQSSLTSFIDVVKPVSLKRKRNIDMALVATICKEFHPFSIVDGPFFRNLINLLNPGYQLPSRKTISHSLLPSLYEQTKVQVKAKLDCAAAICLTTDGWTSPNNTSFLAITAHYLLTDPELVLHSSLLSCAEFPEQHTAQNISNWLMTISREWGIENKITGIVTDNAANMVAAVRLCKLRHITCFAHSLNLIVQKGLLEIQCVVAKVKGIVQYFKQSAQAASRLEEAQKNMNLPQLKLKQDVVTRWNSTYEMLERFFKNKHSLLYTLAVLGINTEKFKIDTNEWLIIEHSLEVLQPFFKITLAISAEKTATISVIPVLCRLAAIKLNELVHLAPEVARMKEVLLEGLKSRCSNNELERHPIIGQAILLDPRFKKEGFSSEDRFNGAVDVLKQKVQSVMETPGPSTSTQEGIPVVPPYDSFWTAFDESIKKLAGESHPKSATIVQVENYLKEPYLPRHMDPFHWWNERKAQYPHLFKLVLRRLCVPATSVPCERVFSKAGYTMNEKRRRLTSKKLDMVLFLNQNCEFNF